MVTKMEQQFNGDTYVFDNPFDTCMIYKEIEVGDMEFEKVYFGEQAEAELNGIEM